MSVTINLMYCKINEQLSALYDFGLYDFRLLPRGADRQRVPTLPPTLDLPASMCEVAAVGTHRSALPCTARPVYSGCCVRRQVAGDILQ